MQEKIENELRKCLLLGERAMLSCYKGCEEAEMVKKEQAEILDDAREEPTAFWPMQLTARRASEFAHTSWYCVASKECGN
jgi:hypothetical protein